MGEQTISGNQLKWPVFHNQEGEKERSRTEQSFLVHEEKIAANRPSCMPTCWEKIWPLNCGGVNHMQKKFFSALVCMLKERDEVEERCRLRKPIQKRITQLQTERLRQSRRSVLGCCRRPNWPLPKQQYKRVRQGEADAP